VLDTAIAQDDQVTVDLRDVTFLDGRAMRILLQAAHRLDGRGGRLRVESAPSMASHMLALCGNPCPFDIVGSGEGLAPDL
jgi:anti-anti-sigma factor